jgi:hypothetical protein
LVGATPAAVTGTLAHSGMNVLLEVPPPVEVDAPPTEPLVPAIEVEPEMPSAPPALAPADEEVVLPAPADGGVVLPVPAVVAGGLPEESFELEQPAELSQQPAAMMTVSTETWGIRVMAINSLKFAEKPQSERARDPLSQLRSSC